MGVLPLLALCRGGVGCDGGPGSFNSGLEAALGQVSNILVLRGKWSLPLWPVSLRLGCRGAASIPGWRTKILHAVRYDQKKSLKKIFFLMKERQNSRRF